MSQPPKYTPTTRSAQPRANTLQQSITYQENILDEVFSSGILSAVTPRQGQLILILAGYAVRDSRSKDYRTAWAYHEDWADKLGSHRQKVCAWFRDLEKAGVIACVGKRHRKGKQPANVYAIADFE